MKNLKFVLLILLVFALSLSLFACGGKETPEKDNSVTTQGGEETPEDKIAIEKELLSEYTIVTPVSVGAKYNNAVTLINSSISEKYGINAKLGDDFLMEGDTPSGKEIILGNANRDFIIEERLASDAYHIYMSGDNIVINGGSPEAIEEAAAYFTTLLFDEGIKMDENGYIKESAYPLANLKINGKYINEYKIITKNTTYGAKYAAEVLQKEIIELAGCKLTITTGKSSSAIYIDGVDTGDGKYYIENDGKSLTLYGSGLNGASMAVNALFDMIGENEEATIENASGIIYTLNNTKKKLEEGSLCVAFLGDSVTAGAGGHTPLCNYFIDLMKLEYPNAEIKMKNNSIGGKNTMWGLYSLESALLSQGYSDLFIISLGTNDSPYGANYNEMAINYQSMVEKIRNANPECEIIFLSYGRENEIKNTGTGNVTNFIKAMLDVANYYGIPMVDTTLPFYNLCQASASYADEYKKYVYDGVHPNAAGQELYANILWGSVKEALSRSDANESGVCYMPEEPLFQNSKKNAILETWKNFLVDVKFGTGEEEGWGLNGTVKKTGASISFDFEGVGIEFGVEKNSENAYFILIEIFDESGEKVYEKEWDSGYYYHIFVTNELEYGKYTVKLTATKPSAKYPSSNPTFTLLDRKIIK